MGIYRVTKNSNYVTMNRAGLNDKRLSWKAKGLLAYMLSMPDDWTFYDTELEQHAKDGRDALKSAIKELKDTHYMKRSRRTGEGGKFIWETEVFEQPYTGFPCMDNPSTEKPLMEKPSMENPQLLSTDELSTDELSTNRTKKENKGATHQNPKKKVYMDFVKLTDEEYSKLIETYGQQATDKLLDNLNNYIGSKGDKYKSHYFTILNWAKRDGVRKGAVNAKSQKQDAERYKLPF